MVFVGCCLLVVVCWMIVRRLLCPVCYVLFGVSLFSCLSFVVCHVLLSVVCSLFGVACCSFGVAC